MKTIYIAGKVTGEPIAECTMKFGNAQKEIENKGYNAINPLEVVGSFNTSWSKAMRLCIQELMKADAVLLLPCSKNSKGAKLEMQICAHLSIPIFTNLDHLKKQVK